MCVHLSCPNSPPQVVCFILFLSESSGSAFRKAWWPKPISMVSYLFIKLKKKVIQSFFLFSWKWIIHSFIHLSVQSLIRWTFHELIAWYTIRKINLILWNRLINWKVKIDSERKCSILSLHIFIKKGTCHWLDGYHPT